MVVGRGRAEGVGAGAVACCACDEDACACGACGCAAVAAGACAGPSVAGLPAIWGTEPTLKGCASVGSGPFAAGLKGCDSDGCCAATLAETSSAAMNIHFEVRMTLLSKFL